MIELPRAALRAGEIAESAEFFSFGTNDLTQTTFGISRDDAASFLGTYVARGIVPIDPFVSIDREGVGELVQIGVERGRKVRPKLKVGICGEHGGDPASVAFCHEVEARLRVLLAVPGSDRAPRRRAGGARQDRRRPGVAPRPVARLLSSGTQSPGCVLAFRQRRARAPARDHGRGRQSRGGGTNDESRSAAGQRRRDLRRGVAQGRRIHRAGRRLRQPAGRRVGDDRDRDRDRDGVVSPLCRLRHRADPAAALHPRRLRAGAELPAVSARRPGSATASAGGT